MELYPRFEDTAPCVKKRYCHGRSGVNNIQLLQRRRQNANQGSLSNPHSQQHWRKIGSTISNVCDIPIHVVNKIHHNSRHKNPQRQDVQKLRRAILLRKRSARRFPRQLTSAFAAENRPRLQLRAALIAILHFLSSFGILHESYTRHIGHCQAFCTIPDKKSAWRNIRHADF